MPETIAVIGSSQTRVVRRRPLVESEGVQPANEAVPPPPPSGVRLITPVRRAYMQDPHSLFHREDLASTRRGSGAANFGRANGKPKCH